MASPQVMFDFIKELTKYATTNKNKINTLVEHQHAKEIDLIKNTNSFCPIKKLKNRTINVETVEKALSGKIVDASILQSLMCLNNSAVFIPQGTGSYRNQKIREYLENLRQIGGESVEGYAMLADIKSKNKLGKDLVVVKTPRQISATERSNQIHEYFIGVFGTNNIRNLIPNFAYILGIFQCSPPYIEHKQYIPENPLSGRQVLTFCQNDEYQNRTNYIIYENVKDSLTFRQFVINGCSFEQYLNVLTQLTLAINLASKQLNFTHYDLHDENVLIRELHEEIYISYEISPNGAKHYLRTKYVATIIDLGRSHIKYNNSHYGYALIYGGTYPNMAYPMSDIYKILMFSLFTALGNARAREYSISDIVLESKGVIRNIEVFQNAKELISYFYPEIERDQVANYVTATRSTF